MEKKDPMDEIRFVVEDSEADADEVLADALVNMLAHYRPLAYAQDVMRRAAARQGEDAACR